MPQWSHFVAIALERAMADALSCLLAASEMSEQVILALTRLIADSAISMREARAAS